MPGQDRTVLRDEGSRTGRQMGLCEINQATAKINTDVLAENETNIETPLPESEFQGRGFNARRDNGPGRVIDSGRGRFRENRPGRGNGLGSGRGGRCGFRHGQER